MSTLTQDCLETHIKNIQCLYADLVNTYVEKLKIGKVCKETELHMLIINEYLDSFYCFEVPLVYINKYVTQFNFSGFPEDPFIISNIVITLSNGTDSYQITLPGVYNSDSNPAEKIAMWDSIKTQLEDIGFTVVSNPPLYISNTLESTSEDLEELTSSWTYTIIQAGAADEFNLHLFDNGSVSQEEVIDNCLTTDQICCMINHTYKILESCNCNC